MVVAVRPPHRSLWLAGCEISGHQCQAPQSQSLTSALRRRWGCPRFGAHRLASPALFASHRLSSYVAAALAVRCLAERGCASWLGQSTSSSPRPRHDLRAFTDTASKRRQHTFNFSPQAAASHTATKACSSQRMKQKSERPFCQKCSTQGPAWAGMRLWACQVPSRCAHPETCTRQGLVLCGWTSAVTRSSLRHADICILHVAHSIVLQTLMMCRGMKRDCSGHCCWPH